MFEEQYIEINDVIYSDTHGYIAEELVYLRGNLVIKRLKFMTSGGYEVRILVPPGGLAPTIYTPEDDFRVKILSSSQVEVKNLNTGQTTIVNEPVSGWPTDPLSTVPNPTETWQFEIFDLIDSFTASLSNGSMNMVNPISKYQSLGVLYSESVFPDSCSATACSISVVLASANIIGAVISCATAGTGIGLAGCSIATAALGVTTGYAIDQCNCTPTDYVPPSVEPIDENESPPGTCDPVCSNLGDPNSVVLRCVKYITTIVRVRDTNVYREEKVCADYRRDP